MAEIDTGNAVAPIPASGLDTSKFDKFFKFVEEPDSAPVITPPVEDAAKLVPVQPAAEPASPAEPTPVEPKPLGLADKIRAEREARAEATKRELEAKSLKERLAETESKLASMNKSDVVADAIGWADGLKLSPQERAIVGETLLYGLVPDKATPEVRIRLLEARQERQRKLDQAEAERRATETQRAQVEQVHQQYIEALASAVETLPSGTHPDSEAWFGEDHESYVKSLYATANNLAEAARAQGRSADLSFVAVAKVLEDDLAVKAQRLRSRGVAPVVQKAEPPPAGRQPENVIVSSKGLGGGGPPRPPARTEAERIARAMEVLTPNK